MLYLLWGLFNLALLLFFAWICFQAAKFLREKYGWHIVVFFVIGLASLAAKSNEDRDNLEPNSNKIKNWNFVSEDSIVSNSADHVDVELEKTLISNYNLAIKYGKDKSEQLNVPVSAYSTVTGFIGATKWKPISISIEHSKDNKLTYHVNGIVKWKLLSNTVYSEYKEFNGEVALK